MVLGDLDNPNKAFAYPIQSSTSPGQNPPIGMDVRDLEEKDQKGTQGVLITKIYDQTKADRVGLRKGDVIVSVNDLPVQNLQAFKKLIRSVRKGEVVKLNVKRQNREIVLAFNK